MIKILNYGEVSEQEIFSQVAPSVNVEAIVSDIIDDVKNNGDEALLRYNLKFDGAALDRLEVTEDEIQEAFDSVSPDFIEVLKLAAENIRTFHRQQVRSSFILADRPGVIMGQKIIPVDRVGLYVPGGTASYPSTVLMDSIPAKIAGCPEVVMVTPPGKDGKIAPVILAAAKIAGIDRIFKVGGPAAARWR